MIDSLSESIDMRHAKVIAVVVLSSGWILPMFIACNTYIAFVNVELYPRLLGNKPLNSFPFLDFTQQMLALSCIWLFLVVVFWSYQGAKKIY